MTQLLNTLYVTTPDAALHLDHDTVRVEIERETRTRLPLLHLGAIVCFGPVFISPALIARCALDGCSVVLLSRTGRFQARVEGPTGGNVLLRRAQHEVSTDPERAKEIARSCIAGKIQNSRFVLLRSARDANDAAASGVLSAAATTLGSLLGPIERANSSEALRGHEGDAARMYFGVFNWMIRAGQDEFRFDGRTRRPPRDRIERTHIVSVHAADRRLPRSCGSRGARSPGRIPTCASARTSCAGPRPRRGVAANHRGPPCLDLGKPPATEAERLYRSSRRSGPAQRSRAQNRAHRVSGAQTAGGNAPFS